MGMLDSTLKISRCLLAMRARGTNRDRLLLAYLVLKAAGDGWVWASRASMAGELGMSEAWVRNGMVRLRRLGLVVSEKRGAWWFHCPVVARRWSEVDPE